jgi:hypothetical protein
MAPVFVGRCFVATVVLARGRDAPVCMSMMPPAVLLFFFAITNAVLAADGQGVAPAGSREPAAVSGSNIFPMLMAYCGKKSGIESEVGFRVQLDRISFEFRKTGDVYEMMPVGIPGPVPSDFKPPKFSIADDLVVMDMEFMSSALHTGKVFSHIGPWVEGSPIRLIGPFREGSITIRKTADGIQMTLSAARSRPEILMISPL